MKKLAILMLHLQHGGIEKQTVTLANALCDRYAVELICTYSMKKPPAYPVDSRVQVRYLMDEAPNREAFACAVRAKNPLRILREGVRAVRILYQKRALMRRAIRTLDCDIVLSTRVEFAEMLSQIAPQGIVTMTQEHLHDASDAYVSRIRAACRGLDYLLVLCEGARENFARWLAENEHIRIVTIPNILEQIPERASSCEGQRLISVGRMHPVKNFRGLLSVFSRVARRVPGATLTLVGGGEELDALKAQASSLGIASRVTFTGMVGADEVARLMQESDVYVMTSLTECFPMVLLEASAAGLPLLSYDVPVGPRAIIADGENGTLIPFEDEAAMADAIVTLLTEKKAPALGARARELAASYLPERVLPLWYELLG